MPNQCPACGEALDAQTGVCPLCVTHARTPSADAVPLSTPQAAPEIPGYKITGHLGEGGMGSLFLAEETALGRRVAIKMISNRIAGDAQSTARFMREARTLATIEHPHVVRVYSFGEAGGRPYLVMEYIEGETLAERLVRIGLLPIDEALRITRQIIDALEAAWERRVVHRDIKPSNILLDKRNQVHVADFGLAKPPESVDDLTLTSSTAIVGTPHYLSPEQAQGKEVDFRSDLYSLGIVLYQMLTGQRPFEGTTPVAIIAQHLHTPLPPLSAPPQVEQLVRAMTEKDPEKRPRSYVAVLEKLDELIGSPSPPAPLPIAVAPLPAARGEGGRRPGEGRTLVSKPVLWLAAVAIPLAIIFAMTRKIPPHHEEAPVERRLVVAVAPFYGPDEQSAREGRLMGALVEREIARKLGPDDVRVVGIDETKKPMRSHDEARALAKTLHANAVIWGEAFALRNETEIQPHVTVMPIAPPRPKDLSPDADVKATAPRRREESPLKDRGGDTVMLHSEAPNQIELRKTSAAGLGDVVTLLAGIHALKSEGSPKRALEFFAKAPRTAETLLYEVQALLLLEKTSEARTTLERSIALDASDARAHAVLGDILAAQHEYRGAAAAYSKAAELKWGGMTQRGIVDGGRLYVKETYRSQRYTQYREWDTPYIVAIDPATEHVVERFALPALPQSFTPLEGGGFKVELLPDRNETLPPATFRDGKPQRPLAFPQQNYVRVRGTRAARAIAGNFLEELDKVHTFNDRNGPDQFKLAAKLYDDAPKTLPDLERALRTRMEDDGSQPWTPFLLALTLRSQNRSAEAAAMFETLLRTRYDVPYYEYSWMLALLERMRLDPWSDALFEKALAERSRVPQPPGFTTFYERLIDAPFGRQAALNADVVRGYTSFDRMRRLTGMGLEADELTAAAWAAHFRKQGATDKAAREERYADAARANKLSYYRNTAILDYALAFGIGALAAFLALLITIAVFAIVRARRGRAIGITATPARYPYAIDVLLFGSLCLAFAYYVAANMFELFSGAVVLTALLGLATLLVIHARIATGVTILDVIAAIGRKERISLLAAYAVLMVAATTVAWRASVYYAIQRIPFGIADSLGHPSVVESFESLAQARDTAAARYVAAVANHYAGNSGRAQDLYATVTTRSENREALERGQPPTTPLSADELYAAVAPSSPSDIIRTMSEQFHGVSFVAALASLAMLTLVLARPRAELTELQRSPRSIAAAIIPAGWDLFNAKWGRAWAIWFAAGVVAVPITLLLTHPLSPGPGMVTSEAIPGLQNATPLPFSRSQMPFEYSKWAFRFALPYAKIFWSLIAALFAYAVAAHVSRLPRVFRDRREMSEKSQATSALSAAEATTSLTK